MLMWLIEGLEHKLCCIIDTFPICFNRHEQWPKITVNTMSLATSTWSHCFVGIEV